MVSNRRKASRVAEMTRREWLQWTGKTTAALGLVAVGLDKLFVATSQSTTAQFGGTKRFIRPDFLGINTETFDGPSWTKSEFVKGIAALGPATLRYPGGEVSNYWDWKTGWILSGVYKPGLIPNPYTLQDLQNALKLSGAIPIFVLNMLTSDLNTQLDMLQTAQDMGIPVNLVELGNEFYLLSIEDGQNTDYLKKFPTVNDYVSAANEWAAAIRTKFPQVRIAAVGTLDSDKSYGVRPDWNDTLLKMLRGVDAVVYHSYPKIEKILPIHYHDHTQHNVESKQDIQDEMAALSAANGVAIALSVPFRYWQQVRLQMSRTASSENFAHWFTEYNMAGTVYAAHGTWLHGLFTAVMTLLYLEDSRAELACQYNIVGNSIYGALFIGSDGFAPQYNLNATIPLNLSASGLTFQILNSVMRSATSAQQITFKPALQITGSNIAYPYPALIGWLFSDGTGTRAVILNLAGYPVTLDLKMIFPKAATIRQFATDPRKFVYWAGSVPEVDKTLVNPAILPPYSMTTVA